MSEGALTLIAFAVGVVVTVGASPLMIRVLQRLSVVDVADHRSSHTGQVLRGGGLAVVIGTAAGLLAASFDLAPVSDNLIATAAICLAFGALGFVDDLHVLPALLRLAAQVALAAAFALLISNDQTTWFGLAAAAVWLVLFVNAFNFMDGINGISGTVSFLVAGGLMITSLRFGTGELSVASAALAGGSLGFLPSNFPNAKVFLGDVGSYFMGTALAALAVLLLIEGAPAAAVLLPFSLYVADVLTTIACRLRKGENILKSHRDHTYQRLANGGIGQVRTTGMVAVLTAALVGIGQAAGDQGPEVQSAMVALAALSVIGYLASPRWLVTTETPAAGSAAQQVEADGPDLPGQEEMSSRAVGR